MPQGVVVGGVGEGTQYSPVGTAGRQPRQMFANLEAGGLGVDRCKLTPNLGGGLGLQIEALVLRQASRKKDIDARFGGRLSRDGLSGSL